MSYHLLPISLGHTHPVDSIAFRPDYGAAVEIAEPKGKGLFMIP